MNKFKRTVEETEELNANRKQVLTDLLEICEEKLVMNEDKLLDQVIDQNKKTAPAFLESAYTEALKWSNRLNWLQQIMNNRYIIPETIKQAKEKEEQSRGGLTPGGILKPSGADIMRIAP